MRLTSSGKPFDEARLLTVVQTAVALRRRQGRHSDEIEELRSRFNALTERQRQVMELAVVGTSSKEIGQRLDLSYETVEHHRAWAMERMGAKTLTELGRIATKLDERP